jgi:hypothetical protein
MVKIITPFLLIIAGTCQGQNYKSFVSAFQTEVMPINTPYHTQSVLFGIKTDDGDQALIGPVYKSFLQKVNHENSYIGVRIFAQSNIGSVLAFLSYDIVWGEYYEYIEPEKVEIKNGPYPRGVIGIGYSIFDYTSIYLGGVFQDYNPAKFNKEIKSPHKSSSFVIRVNISIPVGGGFSSSSVKQRMW